MKKIFSILLLLIAINAKAQYFQHVYGTTDMQQIVSGVNTFIQPQGHLMAFNNNLNSSSASNLIVTYTDVNGDILGTPNFNNEYLVISPISGAVVHIMSANVFELENGSGFGVVGIYSHSSLPTPGIYYLQLDPTGNPVAIYDYAAVPGSVAWYNLTDVGAVAKSPGTDDLYITGTTESSLGQNYIYAMKINTTNGAILWSSFYDVVQGGFPQKEFAGDIIESPYMPLGQPEVVIVGGGYDYNATSFDGFFIRIDANTGIPAFGWAIFYGTAATDEIFTSIDIANSTAGGTNGFIIGGRASGDFWLVKTDPTGGTTWTYTYDYAANPGNNDEIEDVKERLNTLNNYEYYACGTTLNGSFGGADMVVLKVDDLGNGVPGGEFTYNTGWDDQGFALDQYNGTAADGLSVYGLSHTGIIGSYDGYLVKAYFNGISGCNESFDTPNAVPGPGLYSETTLNYFDWLTQSTLLVRQATATDATLCFTTSDPDGDNSRIAQPEPKADKEAIVSPNPMAQGAPIAVVELETETTADVQVAIYDMLGKQYYNGTFSLIKGNNQLPLDIANANMAAGMYTVKITGENISKNILLIIK